MNNRVDGRRLRREIAKRQLTVAEFARNTGLSTPAVYKAMAGSRPTTKTLGKIAEGLGMDDPLELLREEQTP